MKTFIWFSPFQLVHGMEAVLLIECDMSSFKITIDVLPDTSTLEKFLIHIEHINEKRRDATMANGAHKKHVKVQYDKFVHPQIFSKGDLILVYDQYKDTLGAGNFNPMWHDPYIVRCVLNKGTYELE
jgi:hypothetical protein